MLYKNAMDLISQHREYFDQTLIHEVDNLNKRIVRLQEKCEIQEGVKVILRERLDTRKACIEKLKGEKRILKKQMRDLKDQDRDHQKTICAQQKEIRFLEDSLLASRRECTSEHEKLIQSEKEIRSLNSRLCRALSEIENLRSEIQGLDEELKDEKSRHAALKDQFELRTGVSSESEERMDELVQTVEGLKQKSRKQSLSNSEISNYPTSADLPGRTGRRANISSRHSTGQPRGAKKGHPVHKSRLQETPNVKTIYVKQIPTGAVRRIDEAGREYWAVQEIDLKIEADVTEIRMYRDEENGEELSQDLLNRYRINPVAYSESFKSKVHYLNIETAIPLQRISRLLSVLSDGAITLKASTICKWNTQFKDRADAVKNKVLANILMKPMVHVDETSLKVSGRLHWVHSLSNEAGCVFFFTRTRGDKENGPLRYLQSYQGTVISDHFSSYLCLEDRAECMAHIERYLKSGVVLDDNDRCREILEILHTMKKRKEELQAEGKTEMEAAEADQLVDELKQSLETALRDYEQWAALHDKQAKIYKPDYVNTWKRMYEDIEPYVRFIRDFSIPYTNNEAEGQMRKVKGKKNSSGQFVSEDGARSYAAGLSIIQTAKIRDENPLKALESIFK